MKSLARNHEAVQREGQATETESRRSFLQRLGFLAAGGSFLAFGYQSLRSLIPNALYETPQRFKIGHPEQLAEGVTFLDEKRVYVFKEGKTFHAVSASCTHLGCTVKYAKLNSPKQVELAGELKSIDYEFHCPCHGSKFYGDGTNYAGPAPKPLQAYRVAVSPDDGQLMVDLGEEVEREFRLTV